MKTLPFYIPALFTFTAVVSVYISYKATKDSKAFLTIISLWIIAQSAVALSGFYIVTNSLPPRFVLSIAPPIMLIAILFATPSGRNFIDNANLKYLTIIHIIRIPVEATLYALFIYKAIPKVMTFEGSNLDIISGLTAPFAFLLCLSTFKLKRHLLIAWNLVCLGLLIKIVVIAILSTPLPFQRLGYEQPNVAIFYFPFVLLPACIVPLVLFSHLVSIRSLILNKETASSRTYKKEQVQMD